MKKILGSVFCIGCLLASCGGNKSFHVSVDVPSIGTQQITAVYMTAGGERVVRRFPAIDGKFEFDGMSADTTMIELFNARKLLFAAFPAVNGSDVDLRAEGDSLFLAGSEFKPVTSYTDTVLTSWANFGELELVMQYDSVATFPPEGVWFFTSSSVERKASVMDTIRKYAAIDSLNVRDIFVSPDLSQWRLFARRDSATWTQAVLPDAPLVLKDIVTFTPCLVEVDTAGTVLRVQRLE